MKILSPIQRIATLLGCGALLALQCPGNAATLTHRYSFSEIDDGLNNVGSNVVDSVGGVAWSGVISNGGFFTGTQLQLAASGNQHVQFPPGMLGSSTNVTIDMWAEFTAVLPWDCFAWCFGQTVDGGGGNCIFLQPRGKRIAISGGTPSWQAGEQSAEASGGDWSYLNLHVTAVINPPLGYMALYTNGVMVGINNSETVPLSAVSNQLAYIARSLYSGDAYIDMNVNEFRVYDGALTPFEIAGSDLAGPDSLSVSYGTVTNLAMTIPSPIAIGAATTPSLQASASGLLYPIPLNSPDIAVTYSSVNPAVATVNATNGTITGLASGSVNIIASYAGQSATQAVQVISLPTTLAHRYSFTTDSTGGTGVVTDSVGTNHGNFFNVSGLSTISGGALKLISTNKEDYVDLGSYLIAPTNIANNAVTLETWVTVYPGNGAWTRIWDFGNLSGTIGNSSGNNYWSFMPTTGNANNGVSRTEIASGGNVDVDYSGHTFQGWTNVHVVAVYNPNPSRQFLGLYINGALVNSASTGSRTLASLNNVYSWLGRSLWSGDSALLGEIDEFRIYNGELNKFQIAASAQSGPNTINFNIGTVTGFSVEVGAMPLALDSTRTAGGYLHFTVLTNVLVNGDPNLTFTSANPGIFTVNSNGLMTALAVGSANLITTFKYVDVTSGTTNNYAITNLVSVYRDHPQTLTHRYSFTSDARDSVGGPAWDGTNVNSAVFSGGQVYLSKASAQHIQLPSGVISNLDAMTIEAWVSTPAGVNEWATWFYGFGDTSGGWAGAKYVFASLSRNYTCLSDADPGYNNEQGATGSPGWSPGLNGRTNLHWIAVYNPPLGYIAIYTNGVLETKGNTTIPLSSTVSVLNYIGWSLYPGDPHFEGSVDEFRIYKGALHADEVALAEALGPDLTIDPIIATSVSGANLTLSWATNYTGMGYTLESSGTLQAGSWTPAGSPSTVGSNSQVVVPATGAAKFYRLKK